MYSFDAERGILFAGKMDNRFHFDGYPTSDHRKAYESYLYDKPDDRQMIPTLQGDLNNYADMIANSLSKERGSKVTVSFEINRIVEKDTSLVDYSRGTYQTTVYGCHYINGAKSSIYPIIRLPYVDRFGTVTRKGQVYAISATSEPSRFITIDKGHIINIMLQAVKLQITGDTDIERMYTTVAKQNVQLITLIYYISNFMRDRLEMPELYTKYNWIDNPYTLDVPNATEAIKKVVTPGNIAWCYKNKEFFEDFEIYTNKPAVRNTLDKYATEVLAMFGLIEHGVTKISKFDAAAIRESLNELLSIDRGFDRKLSRDIIGKDGTVMYEAGEIVTNEVLMDLNMNHINCYYISAVTSNIEGAHLAFNVGVKRIPQGTLIPRSLIEYNQYLYFACNRYGVTDYDIEFADNDLFVIPEDCLVDSGIVDFILKVDICDKEIQVARDDELHMTIVNETKELKMTKSSIAIKVNASRPYSPTNTKYIVLEEEVMGNQHFFIDGAWKYVSTKDDQEYEPSPMLTAYDLIGLMSLLPRVIEGKYLNKVSDRDYGMRKKICLIDDHLHKAWDKFLKGFQYNPVSRFKQMLKKLDQASTATDTNYIIESYCSTVTNWLVDRTLFSTRDMKVLNLADKICPVSYVSSCNRVNTIVKNKRSASDKMRFLAMGFYGRICPYETPASGKLGLVNTKAVHAHIEHGFIYTDYYRVKNGKILFDEKVSMTVSEEEQYIIADIMSLDFDVSGKILNDGLVLARVPVANAIEKHIVENVPVQNIQLVNCYPDSTISPTATTIPFIGSDDAVRVSYELSMCKQTRGLLYREVPTIMTNAFYDIVRQNTMFQIVAEDDGEVLSITQHHHANSKRAGMTRLNIRYNSLRNKEYKGANDMAEFEHCYEFPVIEYSYSSVIVRYLEVKPGDIVRKGDVLVSSNYTKDGFMATGVDALVAVIPVGYNYEDGVQISDMFDKKLTSFGHSNTELTLAGSRTHVSEPFMRYIDSNATTVLHIHDTQRNKTIPYKTDSLKGWVVNISNASTDRKGSAMKKRIDAVSVNTINEGDKVANRHGNKGVTPKVVNNTDMLYLDNGEIIDLAYNPAGIGSRMILGQIKEIHLGLACKVISIKLCVQSFNELPWSEMKLLLLYAWECANNGVDAANANPMFSMYPPEMKAYVKKYEARARNWAGVFDKNGCAYLTDPRTGKRINKKVVIGYNYVYKLVQEIEEKEHSRGSILSDVPYVVKYAQPTRGASNNGGQSYGYMEQDGLLAHGAVDFLRELKHERGDNIYLRQKQFLEVLGTEEGVDPEALKHMGEFNERRSVEYFKAVMAALGCEFSVLDNDGFEHEEGLMDTSNYEAGDKFFYSDRVILGARTIYNTRNTEQEKEEQEKMVSGAVKYSDDD